MVQKGVSLSNGHQPNTLKKTDGGSIEAPKSSNSSTKGVLEKGRKGNKTAAEARLLLT